MCGARCQNEPMNIIFNTINIFGDEMKNKQPTTTRLFTFFFDKDNYYNSKYKFLSLPGPMLLMTDWPKPAGPRTRFTRESYKGIK